MKSMNLWDFSLAIYSAILKSILISYIILSDEVHTRNKEKNLVDLVNFIGIFPKFQMIFKLFNFFAFRCHSVSHDHEVIDFFLILVFWIIFHSPSMGDHLHAHQNGSLIHCIVKPVEINPDFKKNLIKLR